MSNDDYDKLMTTYEVLEALAPMDVAQMMGQQVHPAFLAGVQASRGKSYVVEPVPARSLNGPAPGALTEEYVSAECKRQAAREADGYELALVTDRHRRWQALFRAMRRAVEQVELDYDPACVEVAP